MMLSRSLLLVDCCVDSAAVEFSLAAWSGGVLFCFLNAAANWLVSIFSCVTCKTC